MEPKRTGVAGLLVIALIGLLVAALLVVRLITADRPGSNAASSSGAASAQGPLRPGSIAPDFTLSDLSGRSVTLSEWHGNVVLINFWASWCGPCEAEMPALDAVYQARRGEELVVLAVAIDDTIENVRRFDRKHQLSFPLLIDERGDVSRAYLVFGVPTTVLVDRDGKILEKHTGALTQEEVETYVARALQKE